MAPIFMSLESNHKKKEATKAIRGEKKHRNSDPERVRREPIKAHNSIATLLVTANWFGSSSQHYAHSPGNHHSFQWNCPFFECPEFCDPKRRIELRAILLYDHCPLSLSLGRKEKLKDHMQVISLGIPTVIYIFTCNVMRNSLKKIRPQARAKFSRYVTVACWASTRSESLSGKSGCRMML